MRVVVIGAGPIGLEAAVEAEARGHEVVVLEAGAVGEHVRRWGHVTLFTPWRMAVTDRGLGRTGLDLADPDAFPTGAELVERYLAPLAATLDVRTGHRVRAIGRQRLRKGDALGSASRADEPFRLVVEAPDGERVFTADAVLDCTGVFGDPAPAGAGGLDAPGEVAARARGAVRYGPSAVDDLAGRPVMLVGDGASAVTVLDALLRLSPPARITWVTPSATVPGFTSPDDDPLPSRRALYEVGRSAPTNPAVDHRPGVFVDQLEVSPGGVAVTLTDGRAVVVDRVLACTGFRPDHSLGRELQLHVCWGSEGPMKLAAALLASNGGAGDCLAQPDPGPRTLTNPEPRLFVLGNKSYGRRSDFLLQVGHKQVRDALDLLEA